MNKQEILEGLKRLGEHSESFKKLYEALSNGSQMAEGLLDIFADGNLKDMEDFVNCLDFVFNKKLANEDMDVLK